MGSSFWARVSNPMLSRRLDASPVKDEVTFFITLPVSHPHHPNRIAESACIQFAKILSAVTALTHFKVRMSFARQRVA